MTTPLARAPRDHRRATFVDAPVAHAPRDAAAPDIPEWTRRYDDERREGVSAVRGLAFACLFAIPPAALLVLGVMWVVPLFA